VAVERDDRRRTAAAVSNALVRLHARHYGKGPTRARTYLYNDFVLTLLHEPFTPAELTFFANGEEQLVRDNRLSFYRMVEDEFRRGVAQLVGRDVVAFMPQVALDPPVISALFLLEPASPTVETT